MADIVHETVERWTRLKRGLGQWPQHWEDLSRVMHPRRRGFITDTQPGDTRVEEIYDGTAMQSARGLANVMGSMLRPEGEPWFFLRTADDADARTGEAKDWLAQAEQVLRDAFDDPRARFRQATGEADLDLVVFGTALKFIDEVVGAGHLMFKSLWLNDAIPFFDHNGVAVGLFRSRHLTVQQVKDRVELDGWVVSERVQDLMRRNRMDDPVEFLYATMPRPGGREDAAFAVGLPFAEMIIEPDTKQLNIESGYHELPYIVSRWDTTSGEDYGRSPGMIALPDANTSQAIAQTMLIAGQRAADPPLLAPSDAFIDAPNTFPGGLATYEAEAVRDLGANPIRPLDGGANFPLTRDIQQDTREQIRMAFFRNVFNLPVEGPSMTATEVIQRREEFIREVGPIFGRLETDDSAPLVERSFKIMLRAGAFGPVPDVLAAKGVLFEYESPVKKIREQTQAQATVQWAQTLSAFEEVKPGAMDVVNFEELGRFTGVAASVPHQVMNSEETVAQVGTARAEAQQQQAELEQAGQAAEVMKNVDGPAQALAGAQQQ